MYNPFYVAGYMCALSFSYNLMMSSIIGKLYSFNAKFPEIECKDKEKKRRKKAAKASALDTNKTEDSGGNDDEEGDLNQQFKEIKKMYKQEQERQKTAAIKIKESMNRTLYGKNAASFRFKTLQIIASYCCCRLFKSWDSLRNNPNGRN